MEKQKLSKPLKPSDKGKTSADKKLRQPANPKRKKAEEEIERFASFPKLNPNPVLEVDSSGKITFHNDAAVAVLKKFNLSEDVSVFLPEDIQEILAGLKQKRERQFYRELIIKGKVFEETIYLAPQFNTLRIYAVDITERKQAETALQVSESKYRSLFANMITGFAYHQIVLNKKGKPVDYVFLEVNDAFEKLTGLKRENIIGKRATKIIPGIENDPVDWIGTYGKVALTGKETIFENYFDALKKWFSISAYTPQKGFFVTVFDDITERKRNEEALQKANEKLESNVRERTKELSQAYFNVESERQRLYSVLEQIPAYVCLLTADYKFAYVNREFKRRFGNPGDRRCHEFLFDLQKSCEGCQTFRIFRENLYAHHWEWNGPDGNTYSISDYPFTDIDGSPLILEMGIDITDRKQAEDALHKSSGEMEDLYNNAPCGYHSLDKNGVFVRINDTELRWLGYSRDEIIGKMKFSDILAEESVSTFTKNFPILKKQGALSGLEFKIIRKDGNILQALLSSTAVKDRAGNFLMSRSTMNDITERKEAENRDHFITHLLELFAKKTSRKEYLDSVVQLLHDWIGCRSVGIRVVNKERSMPYDAYIGFSEKFMRKENMISLDSDACACIRVVSGKFEPQDASAITPNGSFRLEDSSQFADQLTEQELSRFRGNCIRSGYASIAVIPIRYHNQPLGAIHLADEKQNMVPLNTIQFFESMAAPLIGEAIYRFSAEEELTQHRNHLEEIVKERTRELHDIQTDLNRAQTVAHTGSWRLDVRKNELLWSDENWRIFGVFKGTALTYETFLSTIHPDDREYVDRTWKAALQGEPYDIEHRIVVDGQVKWVHERAELEFDTDGMLKGGFGTTQDITEKKQAERDLQTLMEELKRSNSDLEQFAYAASHDLQEPLRVVAGFVSLLEKRYKEKLDNKAHEYIEYAIDGVKRMQVLIKDLLAYSQVGTKGKTFNPTICSVALEQAIYNLHTAIEESDAEITYDRLPTVSADTSQLTRLFQNLIGNAIKFRGEERLKIHIAAAQKGNEWIFSIRDNGIGIDPKFFSRIFVVFQRLHTREEYEGTGIGLAVCKKIVERHGGHMWVESEPGEGTTFYFTMPAMQ